MASKKNRKIARQSAKEVLQTLKPDTYRIRLTSSTPSFTGFSQKLREIENVTDFAQVEEAFMPFIEKAKTTAIKQPMVAVINETTGQESDSFSLTFDRAKLAKSFYKAVLQAQWGQEDNAVDMGKPSSCRYINHLYNRVVNGSTGIVTATNVDGFDIKLAKTKERKVRRKYLKVAEYRFSGTAMGKVEEALDNELALIEENKRLAAEAKAKALQLIEEKAKKAAAPKKRSPRKSAKAVVDAAEVAAKNVVVVEATAEVI